MVLNNEQLKSIAANCIDLRTRINGRAQFVRFTDKQVEVYQKANFVYQPISTPCSCFDFIYDGEIIAFEFDVICYGSRNFLSFDLYDGDVMVHSLFTYADSEGQRQFFYKFPDKKERRVRIFMPFSVGLEMWNFTLDDGSHFTPTPTDGRIKMLFLGDSITHGYDTHYTSMSYAATVARHFDAVCLNHGVGGYVFKAESLDEELPFDPDVITVAYGTNDWGRYGADEEKYREAADEYFARLCEIYPKAKIFGILPVWRADEDRRPERMPFTRVYEILREVYAAHGVTLIDGEKAVPQMRNFYSDGLHPNTIGQHVYGLSVIEALEKAGIKK
ncbi:MAG: SGNH/GDSL hydrolase family protein [Clostridia bacterium]|nr:SGNH/GDSL hydrolase family protein [Clostridia bacterium]